MPVGAFTFSHCIVKVLGETELFKRVLIVEGVPPVLVPRNAHERALITPSIVPEPPRFPVMAIGVVVVVAGDPVPNQINPLDATPTEE